MTQQSTLQHRVNSIDRTNLAPAQLKGLELIETRRRIHELKIMIVNKAEKDMEITVKLIQNWLKDDIDK